MIRWFRRLARPRKYNRPAPKPVHFRPSVEVLEGRDLLSANFLQTNLVSDLPGVARVQDGNLVNPWGLAASPMGPFWVSDNGAGVSTLYNGDGTPQTINGSPTVNIPPPQKDTSVTQASPTGLVFNGTTAFQISENGGMPHPAAFIFATEDGTISAWSFGVDPANALLEVDNSSATPNTGAVYKGLALATDAGQPFLYATNFRSGKIDVFDGTFTAVTTLPASAFTDPAVPAGYAPFGIQAINGNLYVTYAKQNFLKHDDVAGAGNGFVDKFSPHGKLLAHIGTRNKLDSPWGLALAPAGFGNYGGDLLVGNFGDGHINAYDPNGGGFIGTLRDPVGNPLTIHGLWALQFGNGHAAGDTHTLFFTAGIEDESHGLFGSLQAIPPISPFARVLPNLGNGLQQTYSTVGANGDQNPYGAAFVPKGIKPGGLLQPGDLLVSDFNNSNAGGNVQGTGATIVRITPDGQQSVFFQGTSQLGLTTALGVLKNGYVIVGSLPNNAGTIGQGSLLILDSSGQLVSQVSDSALLDGPWDLAINDQGGQAQVFVSNVLNGTVSRIDLDVPTDGTAPTVENIALIGSGYAHRSDIMALEIGPTGLAYDPNNDVLYVASTGDNAIYTIGNAAEAHRSHGKGMLFVHDNAHLHGPLGLVLAPNGHLVVANGDAINQNPNHLNELVEYTGGGMFVGRFQLDTSGTPGGAFGLALSADGGQIRFAAVDDNSNTVTIWTL